MDADKPITIMQAFSLQVATTKTNIKCKVPQLKITSILRYKITINITTKTKTSS